MILFNNRIWAIIGIYKNIFDISRFCGIIFQDNLFGGII